MHGCDFQDRGVWSLDPNRCTMCDGVEELYRSNVPSYTSGDDVELIVDYTLRLVSVRVNGGQAVRVCGSVVDVQPPEKRWIVRSLSQ